ncbi:MAG TPA: hypothetical protein ENG95_07400 [Nitrospirae bacterium]|nr:hypothetical protein [Nitrospirota bacterium]HDK16575.1 hypothetical protein [Nitrospirota bacterium]HDK81039.1 hypothetical protein [Nitrospirota bacterium]HDO26452.1 hypothetical protein [Nitrospirota bacterium]
MSKSKSEAVKQAHENEVAKLKVEMEAVRIESEAIGALKKIRVDKAYNDLAEAVVLYKVKETKAYKKGGMTWEEFCKSIGHQQRTVDRILEDVSPLFQAFSDNLSDFAGLKFNKIRHLGRAVSDILSENEDGRPVYKGKLLSFSGKDQKELQSIVDDIVGEYQTLLDKQEDEGKKLKLAHRAELKVFKEDSGKYKDILLKQNNPPRHFETTWKKAEKLVDEALGIFTGMDLKAVGDEDMKRKYKTKIKTLKNRFDGLYEIMSDGVNNV